MSEFELAVGQVWESAGGVRRKLTEVGSEFVAYVRHFHSKEFTGRRHVIEGWIHVEGWRLVDGVDMKTFGDGPPVWQPGHPSLWAADAPNCPLPDAMRAMATAMTFALRLARAELAGRDCERMTQDEVYERYSAHPVRSQRWQDRSALIRHKLAQIEAKRQREQTHWDPYGQA